MLFKKVTIDDIEILRPFIGKDGSGISDLSIGAILMWRDYQNTEYAINGDALYLRVRDKSGKTFYHVPMGIDFFDGINTLKKELNTDRLSFSVVPETLLAELKKFKPDIEYREQEDFFDYLYSSEDLRSLAGKKYAGQRNMIHQFLRENPNWSYEDLNSDNAAYAEEFLLSEYKVAAGASDMEIEEENKTLEVLRNFDKYRFVGSALKTDGKIVGFSLGEIVGEMAFVHIEKADRNKKGAYQMVVNQFALKYTGDRIKFINREEDVGDAGLRISKSSYHPVKLLRKYDLEI